MKVNSFQVALEEDEQKTTPHGTETVGWLALTPGTGSWFGRAYEAGHNGLFHVHTDHLGSVAVVTKYSDGYIRGDTRLLRAVWRFSP